MDTDTIRVPPTPTRTARRRPRGKGIRVRTGCSACRQRHLKCDEAQPICRACQKSARECIYPQRRQEATREAASEREGDAEPPDTPSQRDGNVSSVALRTAVDQAEGASEQRTETEQRGVNTQSPRDAQSELLPSHQASALARVEAENFSAQGGHETNEHPSQNDGTVETVATIDHTANDTYLTEEGFGFDDQIMGFDLPDVYDAELFGISPESSFGGWPTVSAEAASRWWFDLLAADSSNGLASAISDTVPYESYNISSGTHSEEAQALVSTGGLLHAPNTQPATSNGSREVVLTDTEIQLVQHYVLHLSPWIDATDPDRQFAIIVPDLAMKNRGLTSAILALSSLHVSLHTNLRCSHSALQIVPTVPVQYYNETLHYLQYEMSNAAFLRSDELLATVLTVSVFEMIETQTLGSAWEKHLQAIFWIQRSQTIHGESEGLKKRIWWAW